MPVAFPGGTLQSLSTRGIAELDVGINCSGSTPFAQASASQTEAEVQEIQVVLTVMQISLAIFVKNVHPAYCYKELVNK